MVRYRWPGNVRELRNVIEGAAALAAGPVIQLADLPESVRGRVTVPVNPAGGPEPVPTAAPNLPVPACVPNAASPTDFAEPVIVEGGDEGGRLLAVLRKHNNNRRRAAAELGISRVSLYKKLHKSGLFVPKQRVARSVG
jgi:transcriptional regulator of acetoin/glycerol metabolism